MTFLEAADMDCLGEWLPVPGEEGHTHGELLATKETAVTLQGNELLLLHSGSLLFKDSFHIDALKRQLRPLS